MQNKEPLFALGLEEGKQGWRIAQGDQGLVLAERMVCWERCQFGPSGEAGVHDVWLPCAARRFLCLCGLQAKDGLFHV